MSLSDETNGRAGIDNLTPFEYALAGVAPADGHDSPSLAVIDDMRRLVGEVGDAPVTQARLREFLETGGARTGRASTRRPGVHTAPDAAHGANGSPGARPEQRGHFVDITPIELADSNSSPEETGGQPVVSDPVTAAPEVVAAADVTPGDEATEQAEIDRIHAALRSVLDTGPAAGDSPTVPVDANPVDADPVDTETEHERVTAQPAPPVPPTVPQPSPADEEASQPGNVVAPAVSLGAVSSLFPGVPDAEDLKGGETRGAEAKGDEVGVEHSTAAEAAPPVVGAEPVLTGMADAERSAEGPVLIQAAAGGSILDAQAAPAAPVAPLATIDAGASMVTGRFSNPVVALVATAAAAAVLAIGGLWWASDLVGDDGETEALGEVGADSDGQLLAGDPASDGGADGEPAESTQFGADGSTTVVTRPTVSVSNPEEQTTTEPGSPTTPPPDQRTTAPPVEETLVTEPAQTTERATTEPAVEPSRPEAPGATITLAPQTTAPPPPLPVRMTGSVRSGGSGVKGATVRLLSDADGNQVGNQFLEDRMTSSNGGFSFDAPAGCYELQFQVPAGYSLNQSRQFVCLEPGQSTTIDIAAQEIRPDPPGGCHVEPKGRAYWLGVEVFEYSGNWAESYTFYDDSGSVVVRTRDMGPPDDIEGFSNREWHAADNGFDHRRVYSVAAERGGVESQSVSCQRD